MSDEHDPLKPHSHEPNPEPPSADPSFLLRLPDGHEEQITLERLKAFRARLLPNCYIVSTGHGTSGPFMFVGVPLVDLVKHYAGQAWSQVEVISADGFGNRVTREELLKPEKGFIHQAYTEGVLKPGGNPIILAYSMDSRPLTREQGLVRLIVPSEKDDALRQVKWVGRINIISDAKYQIEEETVSTQAELAVLLARLKAQIARPGMYGLPEHIELVGKHFTHIYLSILSEGWAFKATENFYEEIAQTLGEEPYFTPPYYEQKSFRKAKWGSSEKAAQKQVIQAFQAIRDYLVESGQPLFPHTKKWTAHLLKDHTMWGSPNSLNTLLDALIFTSCASQEAAEQYRNVYYAVARALKGSSSTGLLDLQVKQVEPILTFEQLRPSYERVAQGHQELIKRLEAMTPRISTNS